MIMTPVRPNPPFPASVSLFALPFLPVHTRLLFDGRSNTALVLHLEQTEIVAGVSCQLTPSAARILLCLLQNAPAYCSYQSLFQALYPLDEKRTLGRSGARALALRPVRRAVVALSAELHRLGLQVVALRGLGYILAAREAEEELFQPDGPPFDGGEANTWPSEMNAWLGGSGPGGAFSMEEEG